MPKHHACVCGFFDSVVLGYIEKEHIVLLAYYLFIIASSVLFPGIVLRYIIYICLSVTIAMPYLYTLCKYHIMFPLSLCLAYTTIHSWCF